LSVYSATITKNRWWLPPLTDTTTSCSCVPCRSSSSSRQVSQGYSNVALLAGCVNARSVQHRSTLVSCHVYICYLWHVFLHACQEDKWYRWCIQLRDIFPQHDHLVPGLIWMFIFAVHSCATYIWQWLCGLTYITSLINTKLTLQCQYTIEKQQNIFQL